MSSIPEKTEEEWDELLKRMMELDKAEDTNTCYIYGFYDPTKKTFVYIGRGDEHCAKYNIREKFHLTTSKNCRDYKQAIQDSLDSTGLKIVRLFTNLSLEFSQDYEAAMLLAKGGTANKASGAFRGPFINFTKKEKIEEGKRLLEEAKKICERNEHPIYTRANVKDFKPAYIPIVGYCSKCDAEDVELVKGPFCEACDSWRASNSKNDRQPDEASEDDSMDDE